MDAGQHKDPARRVQAQNHGIVRRQITLVSGPLLAGRLLALLGVKVLGLRGQTIGAAADPDLLLDARRAALQFALDLFIGELAAQRP